LKNNFVGRKRELEKLSDLHKRPVPSLAVIMGRRRIGKSRLIEKFATISKNKLWNFIGIAPQDDMTDQTQRDHFAQQLAIFLNIAPPTFNDWSDAFDHLSLHLQNKDIVLFDEISWMGNKDSTFIPKLKAWWDNQVAKTWGNEEGPSITLVLCGSVSTWIEENILKSTALFGRINLTIELEPLSIVESVQLLTIMGFQGSEYDTYKILAICGGVPWYLEQAGSGFTADAIIKKLCFEKKGLLVSEFDHIFHDLFNGKSKVYKKIIDTLKTGNKTLSEIRTAIKFAPSGTLSTLIEQLTIAGFVKKQQLWSFKTSKSSKQSIYFISDPYMRFYLKVIEPDRARIDAGNFTAPPLSSITYFDTHMGLQIETLLLQNRSLLLESMRIFPDNVINDGPYRQPKTTKNHGCQVDYLVQTDTKNIFVCEFKFKRHEFGMEIIHEMKKKIKALKVPKGFAVIPVLFHISGVSEPVTMSNYFYRIIDITDFLPAK